ncbi:hypothetical protein LUZ60_006976 [Juncus effusus]|nr:hypothetical protein LUZ60_006976 [Juncus effusus]
MEAYNTRSSVTTVVLIETRGYSGLSLILPLSSTILILSLSPQPESQYSPHHNQINPYFPKKLTPKNRINFHIFLPLSHTHTHTKEKRTTQVSTFYSIYLILIVCSLYLFSKPGLNKPGSFVEPNHCIELLDNKEFSCVLDFGNLEEEMEAKLGGNSGSNLETFLSSVTPSVPLFSLSKSNFKEPSSLFHPDSRDLVDCFSLEDLWDWYNECSAYGLGVPLSLNTKDNIVQYYVPYLSAIQIYTSKSVLSTSPRNNNSLSTNEESESDSWSDDSEKLSKSWDTVSSSDDLAFDSDAFGNVTNNNSKERFGNLYFNFVEWDSPYERIPLFDKINELSKDHPGLMSFKSAELSPASWMSIAWYPIYHVPTRGNLKEMTTCFLTYHTISSLFQDSTLDEKEIKTEKQMSLSPFGLATYKMQGSVWRDLEASRRISTLHSAADSWLKQLGVHHHDFNFFSNHCK